MAKGIAAPGTLDRRTLRATGRTQQFATRVTEEWHAEIKSIAERDGLKLVEVLEDALAAYEAHHTGDLVMSFRVLWTQANPEQRDTIRKLIAENEAQ